MSHIYYVFPYLAKINLPMRIYLASYLLFKELKEDIFVFDRTILNYPYFLFIYFLVKNLDALIKISIYYVLNESNQSYFHT